jgi:hypothetical protein
VECESTIGTIRETEIDERNYGLWVVRKDETAVTLFEHSMCVTVGKTAESLRTYGKRCVAEDTSHLYREDCIYLSIRTYLPAQVS